MKIEIRSCLEGALSARGLVILVDVFRAGNTAAGLLAAGAPFVLTVAELDEALRIKAENPDWLLVGERGGVKPEGFDLNNSPAQALLLDLDQRPAVLTTSAGTRGLIAAAPQADELIMATLVNSRAAAAYVRGLSPDTVSIVPIGLEARIPAVEDEVVALYLADLLEDRAPDYRQAVRAMLLGPGAERLRRLGQWRDLAFCLRLDRLPVIPRAAYKDDLLVLVRAGQPSS